MRKIVHCALMLGMLFPAIAHSASGDDMAFLWERMDAPSKKAYTLGYVDAISLMCSRLKDMAKYDFEKCFSLESPSGENSLALDEVISYYDDVYLKNKIAAPFSTATFMLNSYGKNAAISKLTEIKKNTQKR